MSENNSEWKCPKCGALNSYGNFCGECGEPKVIAASFAPKPADVPASTPAPVPAPVQAQEEPSKAPQSNTSAKGETREEKKAAEKMCIISLVCMYASPVVFGTMFYGLESLGESLGSDIISYLALIPGLIYCLSGIAAIVLMIVARVKYPKNTFAKVVMWIYIGQAILSVVATILTIIFCAASFSYCVNEFNW
ncbi:MAG: hypothetical protein K6F49_10540 [Saccharofermentans sp.]|nr:hypothetical protein [Saccharofermentans sp.]